MARTYAGADYIIGGIGSLVGIGSSGHTLLTICRRAANGAWHTPLSIETSAGSSKLALQFSDTNKIQLIIGSSNKDTTVGISSADNWVLAAVTRASGSSVPRGHKYVYDTNTWTHTDAGAASGGDSTDLTGGQVQAGRWQTTDFMNGDILLDAAFKRALTDGELESLPFSLMALLAAAPDALLLFDQHATTQSVIDLTGGGAGQTSLTNTSVATSSVPLWSYGAGASVAVGQAGGATTHNATAALTVTATTTAAAAADKPVAATLAATATLTAAAVSTKPVDAALTVTAAGTAAATTTKPVAAALTAAATVTAAAAATKPVAATTTTTAAITAAATSTKPVDATLTVTAALTATASVDAAAVTIAAAPTYTATITAVAAGTRPAAAALTATATLTTAAAATKPVQAALTVTATLTADAAVTGSGLAGRVHGPESQPPGAVVSTADSVAGASSTPSAGPGAVVHQAVSLAGNAGG